MEKEDFKQFIEEKRLWYQQIGKVFCPVLNEWVIFNAKGFYHLRYDGAGKQRLEKDQYRRMNLLKYASHIINTSIHVVEKRERSGVMYWKIQKKIYDKRVSVILRKTGTGPYIFYSIWSE